jgi:uncharacterized MnhB-related membrane protein
MPFVAVIVLSVIAFTFCYLVLLPNSPEFAIDDSNSGGMLKPFITVYRLVRTLNSLHLTMVALMLCYGRLTC